MAHILPTRQNVLRCSITLSVVSSVFFQAVRKLGKATETSLNASQQRDLVGPSARRRSHPFLGLPGSFRQSTLKLAQQISKCKGIQLAVAKGSNVTMAQENNVGSEDTWPKTHVQSYTKKSTPSFSYAKGNRISHKKIFTQRVVHHLQKTQWNSVLAVLCPFYQTKCVSDKRLTPNAKQTSAHIFRFLPLRDLGVLEMVCSTWQKSLTNRFWVQRAQCFAKLKFYSINCAQIS